MKTILSYRSNLILATYLLAGGAHPLLAASNGNDTNVPPGLLLFSTGFEASEGYNTDTNLVGQNGWISVGSGGNGMVSNFFSEQGHQAFIGYGGMSGMNDTMSIWRPINYSPTNAQYGQIEFTVWLQINASTNQNHDNFRWNVHNTNGMRLFSVDFNTRNYEIAYMLDNRAGLVHSGWSFTNDVRYTLRIDMDFISNNWNAYVGTILVVTNQPITTTGAPLNLGDIDAVWVANTIGRAGNNFMLFDNYSAVILTNQIPAEPVPTTLTLRGAKRLDNGQFNIQLTGLANQSYAIEVSTNLSNWLPLNTNNAAHNGTFDFIDPVTNTFSSRFYRARQVIR